MTNTVGFRPLLHPPGGRQLQRRSYRPLLTCLTVSGCITLLVWVVFVLTAFNIYSHRFGRTEHRYHAGDEMSLRQASGDLSATFCSAYTLHSDGWTDFYLLPHRAEIESGKRIPMSFRLTLQPVPYVAAIHYLPVNSTVTLAACYKDATSDLLTPWDDHDGSLAKILVIVGDDNFREWGKRFNFRHARYRVPIPRNATCNHPASVVTLNFTAPASNNYHFVLTHRGAPGPRPKAHGSAPVGSDLESNKTATTLQHLDSDGGSILEDLHLIEANNKTTLVLTGDVSKTVFNLSAAESVCSSSEKKVCQFPLQWGHGQDVVAKILTDRQDPDAAVTFSTRCHERLEMWIPVFGGVPVVITVVVWLCCWRLLVRNGRDRRTTMRESIGGASSSSCVGPHGAGYGSVTQVSGDRDPLVTPVLPPRASPPPPEMDQDTRCVSIQG
ncbi:hypothetical protein ACOMHN_013779 [Nucella lapillus]